MTEQAETEEQIRERGTRLHKRAHEVMDALKEAAPHIQRAYQILYDGAEDETNFENRITSYVMAGQCAAIIGQMNDMGKRVHDAHEWGFLDVRDALMAAILAETFEHATKGTESNGSDARKN
jgi:hypothetical protein